VDDNPLEPDFMDNGSVTPTSFWTAYNVNNTSSDWQKTLSFGVGGDAYQLTEPANDEILNGEPKILYMDIITSMFPIFAIPLKEEPFMRLQAETGN